MGACNSRKRDPGDAEEKKETEEFAGAVARVNKDDGEYAEKLDGLAFVWFREAWYAEDLSREKKDVGYYAQGADGHEWFQEAWYGQLRCMNFGGILQGTRSAQ